MKPKIPHSDIFTFLIGALIASVLIIAGILLLKVLWPLTKWIAKKGWAKLRGKTQKADAKSENLPTLEIEARATGNGLPTPDIFKDSPNLAPLREFRF
jgi:hypothetical protein